NAQQPAEPPSTDRVLQEESKPDQPEAPPPARAAAAKGGNAAPARSGEGPRLLGALPSTPALPDETGDGSVVPASCSSCGGGVLGLTADAPGFCASCGNHGCCVPGQKPCFPCCADTCIGRFLCGLYECICCPDPCYDPKWNPVADAAFFVEAARPVTNTRLRWNSGIHMDFPDRNEFFSAPPH